MYDRVWSMLRESAVEICRMRMSPRRSDPADELGMSLRQVVESDRHEAALGKGFASVAA